jgi:hypothetical protein
LGSRQFGFRRLHGEFKRRGIDRGERLALIDQVPHVHWTRDQTTEHPEADLCLEPRFDSSHGYSASWQGRRDDGRQHRPNGLWR